MPPKKDPFKAIKKLDNYSYYALSALENQGFQINRLPISIRIILESLLRNCDGLRVTEEDVKTLASWSPKAKTEGDVPFIVSRVILQDFTGVPLLVDLAAMRDAVAALKKNPSLIEPQVPVDLVVDHSVQVDRSGTDDAFTFNLEIEFERNIERYQFLKWGQQAFNTFRVIPPGIGIVHQVNLEHIASVVAESDGFLFPDTLVGTDSHTPMVNGLGVVGWGVGGIEAEAAMLGQPVALQMPEVIGVHLSGALQEGVTATDLTLRVTELLRKEKVVGKFVEFFGEGASSLSVADRATIGNMAPEYGATIGYFGIDQKTIDYLYMTGRKKSTIERTVSYLKAQGLFGIPKKGEVDYTKVVELDLSSIIPSVAGPKRPQDLIPLQTLKAKFTELLSAPIAAGGYSKADEKWPKVCVHSGGHFSLKRKGATGGTEVLDDTTGTIPWDESEMVTNRPFTQSIIPPGYGEGAPDAETVCDTVLTHGSVVIAAITSCTNTSNPQVMLAAGLLAKKAVERGLRVNALVKTSLAPGSRVVTDYLEKSGLQYYLNILGFQLVAYGCTTCIGNSGPLDERIEGAIKESDLVVASVLSGNRNFEARIHSAVKANFLMSPPLVVAFALAGRVDIDMEKEPLGFDVSGKPVFLKELWPSSQEIEKTLLEALQPDMFERRYAHVLDDNAMWPEIQSAKGDKYLWDKKSTYIQCPPYFDTFSLNGDKLPDLKEMRPLALFGDSVTTDHISPAGSFKATSSAGEYLIKLGVLEKDFNSFGSRRGNHNVMLRGTFANVRIRNLMADGKEGGYTLFQPSGKLMTIYDAAEAYAANKTPLIIFAGKDYGMGSSRDWAAKGTALLGVKAVVARSFERIHRSNLIGMGVLPLEFAEEEGVESLQLKGDEVFTITGLKTALEPHQKVTLEIKRKGGKVDKATLLLRLDTPMEIKYYMGGGIMPYVLRELIAKQPER